MDKEEVSQEQILKEFFLKNPKKSIAHYDSVGWCMKEYKKRTGKVFVDRIEPFNKLIRGTRNMIEGAQPHIAVLGSHGIGKTHFIEFAFEFLKENKDKIGIDNFYYIKGQKGV